MFRHQSRLSISYRRFSARRWTLACWTGLLFVLLGATGCGSEDDQVAESLSQSKEAIVPTGFTQTLVASGLSSPTAMDFAPDGRLFVCEQSGRLRVIKNGALLPTPFLTQTVDPSGERGLLGVAIDPNFASNSFVYVYYTATTPAIHNRVSRFTASGDVAVPGSEVVLMDLENLGATNHNGGVIHFRPDGKLYIAVGDNALGANASQSLSNRLGKILRINSDGSIPSDNPTSFPGISGTTSGVTRAIWAVGLRNPFTFAVQPGTGRMFINDVGESTWEEIDDGLAGRNYGWPTCEGTCSNPNFTNPLYTYNHSGGGCAITGGAFYNPTTQQFPSAYVGEYFFADYCGGWIQTFDPSTSAVTSFVTGIASPVDLKVHPDGSLYYVAYAAGAVFKVQYTGSQAPSISTDPSNATVSVGQSATFSVTATGTAPLSYQWQKNGASISGATASSYTTPATTAGDNGATFRCVVSNGFGNATSNAATLTVTSNTGPTATITAPANGSPYSGGDVVNYSGTGTDAQDGTLPGSAMTWQVDFGHDTHFHPFIPATTGSTGGSFTIPTTGETSANVYYRIILTVRDAGGLTNTTFVDIRPRTSTISLASNPSGLQLLLDGQPVTTPFSVLGVQGITRQLDVVSPQIAAGRKWIFSSWSDGGAAAHSITTPTTNTTYTATYRDAGLAGALDQDPGPDGLISFEAENYDAQVVQGGHSWNPVTPSGASGIAMSALPNIGTLINTGYTTGSPRLDYQVTFVKTGIHYIWVRGIGSTGDDDSCHVGLDGQANTTSDRIGSFPNVLTWWAVTMDGPVATINVPSTGLHTINLWMREDGFIADKLVITTNANYTPTGTGPAESTHGGSGNMTPTVPSPPASTATASLPTPSPTQTATAPLPTPSPTRTATAPLATPSPTQTATAPLPTPSPTRTATAPLATPSPTQTATVPPSPVASPSPATRLGLTTIGSITDSWDSNYLNGSRVFASTGGQMVSMSAYVGAVDSAAANRRFQMAIYTDSAGRPGTLVATTSAGTLVANSWNTLPITGTLQANANYWLMYNTNGQTSSVNNMLFNSGAAGQAAYSVSNVTFGTWPSTFPTSVMTNTIYSLYLTLGP